MPVLLVLACNFAYSPVEAQITTSDDKSSQYPPLKGSPVPSRRPPGIGPTTGQELPKLRGLEPENNAAMNSIEELSREVTDSTGSIFVDPEKVMVKPPVLKSLITLNDNMSPLALDADMNVDVNLRDVLLSSLSNNLPIQISNTMVQSQKWKYAGALSGFLPSLTNTISFQALHGNYVSPAGLAIGIKNPYFTSGSGFQQYLFKGGSILFTAKQHQAKYRAAKYELKGTINDMLLDTTDAYYDLVRSDVLLQIRVKAVEVSKALLMVNQDLFENGVNTQLDVLQAKYQLANDRQHLIKQQVQRRQAAVKLATILNMDQGTDLNIKNRLVSKQRLVDVSLRPADLLRMAIERRPELKKYEQLRLAAKDAVRVARSSLVPSVAVTGTAIGSGSNATNASVQSLNTQQTSVSSTGASVGSVGSAGGLPLATSTTNSPKKWTTRSLFTIGVDVQWTLGGLGLQQIADVRAHQWEARRVTLEGNRELERICKEVRDSYLANLSAENLIIETTDAVKYAEEGLRLAELRFKEGIGTYLDVINAQHGYTDALIDKANAIIDFNQSQARLLRATGCLTVDTATAAVPLKQPPG